MKSNYDVVLHIPSLKGGGAERVAVEIGRYFSEHGKSTAFFIHHSQVAYDLPGDVDVIVARNSGHVQRVLEFRAFLKEVRVHTVISFLPYANLISVLANVGLAGGPRLVVSEHLSYVDFGSVGPKERFKLALTGYLYKRADGIVAVSTGVADDLRQRLSASAARKVVVIHNPCYIPNAESTRLLHDGSAPIVLAVGRLVRQKGLDVLITAFSLVRKDNHKAQLVIVGEGPDRGALEEQIAQLGLNGSVTLRGFSRNIADEYKRADLFVCSSRAEGFGNVIVEALSFGLPVVSTACKHGPEEILEGGRYGTLVPVGDPISLSAAIVTALRTSVDPEVQIKRAKDFGLAAIGRRYMTVAGFAT
ncbi:glycosyltransferase [Caballeronia sordidicola]|uniref:Glycosyltransferase n=1 Tax=Caballeronia sordidicola TaxID=196367 RepID=A0A242MYH8_CABSO|nr:glycosyltransferase [Caballeronia sordidicola]OTP75946.1 Glycosyltransferase [Caballeronia sordidicola]